MKAAGSYRKLGEWRTEICIDQEEWHRKWHWWHSRGRNEVVHFVRSSRIFFLSAKIYTREICSVI